ncbi:MAG: ABC transporter permease [Ruminococcus sp.]|nr:ABC transporter permease [Ruminococcus sp.]
MTVFNAFMKIVLKRLRTSMIYIVIFVSICVGLALNSKPADSFTDYTLDISINDLDDTPASRAIAEYIADNHNVVETITDKDDILDSLFYLKTDIVLTINKGYSENLAKGQTDELFSAYRIPDSYYAELFDSQINNYIGIVSSYIAGGDDIEKAVEKAGETASLEVEVTNIKASEKSNSSGITVFFQYIPYILILSLVTAICPSILTMTSNEIRNRTNCSCVSSAKQLIQLVLGTVIVSFSIFLILIIASIALYRGELFTSTGLLALLNAFVFLLFVIMFTLLIAVIAPSPRAVDMIANIFGLGMSFLCGVFVPQYLLSDAVLSVGKFFPAYWYVKANNMLAGVNGYVFTNSDFFTAIAVQLAFTVAIFFITLLISKSRRSAESIN